MPAKASGYDLSSLSGSVKPKTVGIEECETERNGDDMYVVPMVAVVSSRPG